MDWARHLEIEVGWNSCGKVQRCWQMETWRSVGAEGWIWEWHKNRVISSSFQLWCVTNGKIEADKWRGKGRHRRTTSHVYAWTRSFSPISSIYVSGLKGTRKIAFCAGFLGIIAFDINTKAYENVKNTWEKRGIWNVRWGILPGTSWKHEQPLEDLLKDPPNEADPVENGDHGEAELPFEHTDHIFGILDPILLCQTISDHLISGILLNMCYLQHLVLKSWKMVMSGFHLQPQIF